MLLDEAPGDLSMRRWASLFRRVFGPADNGFLHIDLPSGQCLRLAGKRPGRDAHVAVRRWSTLMRLALRGDIGFAESIIRGDVYSKNLKHLLLWAIENTGTAGSVGDGIAAARLGSRVRHALRANTLRKSRRNIAAHYDLGNAFYECWLDEGLNYSSGIYASSDATLAHAQAAKIARIADLLELRGGERVLEIGCGWGALAEHLITAYECHVTGLTLSGEQQAHAIEWLSTFAGRAEVRLQDYRDVTGTFDRIASIEMMEAVGESYWPAYFKKIASSLAVDGTAVLQVITIDDARYDAYRRRPDFIQLSIFPGGMLPTKSVIAEQARHAGLCLTRDEYFGASYARTLADWRQRFNRSWPMLQALGFDERFRRLWNYYLLYCEAGFEAGWVDVGLYQLKRL
ncbi:MAG: class I SAM-dependent methyltransferase [Hyphomicrobiaceae bacterium]